MNLSSFNIIRSFLGLGDTPNSFSGQAGKVVRVNSGENALEFEIKPSFSVHKNGVDQTGVVTATDTKVTWPNEEFDTNGNFASDRFTPTVQGKYFLLSSLLFSAPLVDQKRIEVKIFKNGVVRRRTLRVLSGTLSDMVAIAWIVEANGTTDYFELYTFHNTGSNEVVNGDVTRTYFQGFKID